MMDKREPPAERIEPSERELAPDAWKWHRLRNLAIGIEFWPLEWNFGFSRWDDFYGGKASIGFGPFVLTLNYNSCTGIFGRAELDVQV